MFRDCKISLLGLYEYSPDIFDDMVVPDGVDKDVLTTAMCANSAELSTIYPNAPFMRKMLGNWSKMNLTSWERVYKALSVEYDPISNYDRREEWTDTGQQTAKGGAKVAGFNVGELVDSQEANQQSNASSSHSGRMTGNIGVTTNQQMINEEIALRKTSIYDFIVSQFIHDFCIMVY